MKQSDEIRDMRFKLLTMYPSGVIRGQRIIDMPDYQVYALYKSHRQRGISMKHPRMMRNRQIPGQINMFKQM